MATNALDEAEVRALLAERFGPRPYCRTKDPTAAEMAAFEAKHPRAQRRLIRERAEVLARMRAAS